MDYAFLRYPNFKKKAVTLSYDDGVVFDKKLLKIMQENGLKGTFNINSGLFAKESGGRRMTEEECIELYSSPNAEVAVHGTMHRSLSKVSPANAIEDIISDRKNLERIFKKRIQGMAYANGHWNDEVAQMMKMCGIKYARTVTSTENFDLPKDWLKLHATCHHANPKLMELAEKFVNYVPRLNFWWDEPILFYLWGHSYEFNDKDNWYIIEEFAKYIGNREDIWYATNGEICEYVQAFDNLVFGLNEDYIYNPTAIDLYVAYMGKNYLVPSGQTIRVKD